jgi:hypothetical protein
MLRKKPLFLFLFFFFILSLSVVFASGKSGGSLNGKEPDWVTDPYKKYDRQANVAAVGSGDSRESAEKSAIGNLVGIFGMSIQVDEKVTEYYEEAVKSGVAAAWSQNTTINTNIITSTALDSLIGAETGEVWRDSKGFYYAVAVLNKAKAAQIYTDMIKANQAMIDNLTAMSEAEKNTMDGYARYKFAAVIADISVSYGNLLSVIGRPQNLKRGDDYRLEARNIAASIPVGLSVKNDKANRIQGAFANALSQLGFRSSGGNSGGNSRYMLDVNIVTSPVDYPGNQNVFTRIEVNADLKDTATGAVLVPFAFNSREGHTSQAEADNRAYATAERKINQDYAGLLESYLSSLLPKR